MIETSHRPKAGTIRPPDITITAPTRASESSRSAQTTQKERLNREIRRRTDVVGRLPECSSALRLIGAVPAEQHEECSKQRRYMGQELLLAVAGAKAGWDETEGVTAQMAAAAWDSVAILRRRCIDHLRGGDPRQSISPGQVLARGELGTAAVASLTPEGHGVRFDADGDVIGLTVIAARRRLERDGHLTIALPQAVRVEGTSSQRRWSNS